MSQPAAKQGDKITAFDIHEVQPPGPVSPQFIPGHIFNGIINGNLSSNVNIMGMPAATVGSTALNTPIHIPLGVSFVKPPSNQGTIKMGSITVHINGKQAARSGDMAETCNDPEDLPVGTVVAVGTVFIGG